MGALDACVSQQLVGRLVHANKLLQVVSRMHEIRSSVAGRVVHLEEDR
jgi:hypothetical protein